MGKNTSGTSATGKSGEALMYSIKNIHTLGLELGFGLGLVA